MMILVFIAGFQDDYVDLSHKDRVPRFWDNSTRNNAVTTDTIVVWVGVLFGVIHCIA